MDTSIHTHNLTGLNSWEFGYRQTPCAALTHCPSFCDCPIDGCTATLKPATLVALPALRVGDVTEDGTVTEVAVTPEPCDMLRVTVTFDNGMTIAQPGRRNPFNPSKPMNGGSWAGINVYVLTPCPVCGDKLECEH